MCWHYELRLDVVVATVVAVDDDVDDKEEKEGAKNFYILNIRLFGARASLALYFTLITMILLFTFFYTLHTYILIKLIHQI